MRITAESLSVVIDQRPVVTDVDLTCAAGATTALVGPSGSGKTTLLHALGLLVRPTSGRVLVDGMDTTQWNARRRRRFWSDNVSFVLQDYGVMEEESVAFNVTMRASVLTGTVRADRQRLEETLELTGLAGREDEPASHLSGGEKQRLAVARAVYKDASVVLVDEPTASLDAANRSHVIDLFTGLARRGCVVVVATHDDEMMAACDRRFPVHAAGSVRAAVAALTREVNR